MSDRPAFRVSRSLVLLVLAILCFAIAALGDLTSAIDVAHPLGIVALGLAFLAASEL